MKYLFQSIVKGGAYALMLGLCVECSKELSIDELEHIGLSRGLLKKVKL